MLLSTFSIILSLVLLIVLAYRGWSIILLSPLLSLLVVLITCDGNILVTYTHIFMTNSGNFIVSYFPIFLLSAIFGKLMEKFGFAKAIAIGISEKIGKERAISSVALASAVLTYGGVSLFVVVFAVYPIAVELFRKVDIPKRIIPASIALGAFTFTMTALPGTPSIQNIIPSTFFGTSSFSAPGIGIISSLIIWFLGITWLNNCAVKAKATGEGYGDSKDEKLVTEDGKIPFIVSLLPVFSVIFCNFYFVHYLFTALNFNGFDLVKYGVVSVEKMASNWAIISALFVSILLIIMLGIKNFRKLVNLLNESVCDALSPIFNTASVVGYGAVISSLAGFKLITNMIMNVCPTMPTISSVIATSTLAGITGSASGGMTIALNALGSTYLNKAIEYQINPELLHRLISISSGCLDTLPHNGAVITLLAICGLKHRDAYKNICVTTLIIPLIAVIFVIIIGHIFGSF